MKRQDIEEKFFSLTSALKSKIEGAPIPAVASAFLAGIIFACFWRSLLLLLLILVVVAFSVWFLANDGGSENQDRNPPGPGPGRTNGSGKREPHEGA
jgi:hypothetical protein